MQTTVETIKTETHVFWILNKLGEFHVEYRPINPKTGELWQASKRVDHGADVTPGHWDRPVAYSTLELARQAVAWQTERLAKTRRRAKAQISTYGEDTRRGELSDDLGESPENEYNVDDDGLKSDAMADAERAKRRSGKYTGDVQPGRNPDREIYGEPSKPKTE